MMPSFQERLLRAYIARLEAVAEAASDEDMLYAMDSIIGFALIGIEALPDETAQADGDEADAHLQSVREGWNNLQRAVRALLAEQERGNSE